MDVFYFHARYCCDTLEKYEERDEYGFVSANNFIHAMEQISNYYKDDLISVDIQYAGDTGMITIDNKEIAEAFKKSYIKTHYGEDEE